MKPAVGKIVHFLPYGSKRVHAAMIISVEPVCLQVFGHRIADANFKVDNVLHSLVYAHNCWSWPPND